jgi:hypothetical protein
MHVYAPPTSEPQAESSTLHARSSVVCAYTDLVFIHSVRVRIMQRVSDGGKELTSVGGHEKSDGSWQSASFFRMVATFSGCDYESWSGHGWNHGHVLHEAMSWHLCSHLALARCVARGLTTDSPRKRRHSPCGLSCHGQSGCRTVAW